MKKIVRKLFWVWKQEEEIKFLEEMALNGFKLEKVRLGEYIFEEDKKQKLIYQIDFRGLGGRISEEEYIQIYDDAGWKLASKFGAWYYFYQEWKEGINLSIFNDNETKSTLYKRLLIFLMIIGFPFYYQTLIMFPNMLDRELEFPNFYFFFRIIVIPLIILHVVAVLKVFGMYRKWKRSIKE